MKKILVFMILSIICSTSYAVGTAIGYTVQNVRVDKSGFGYIKFVQALQGSPATCISNHDFNLSFDTNTAGGKGVLSLALTAQATGKRIEAWGTGTCNEYGVVESWQRGWVLGP